MSRTLRTVAATLAIVCSPTLRADTTALTRPFTELSPVATVRIGHTADWVAVTADAVWVGSTGPFAVSRIDPASNARTARVLLPGEPCAGLVVAFGALWVPLCTHVPSLARIDLATLQKTVFTHVGPAAAEGGIAASADSLWLVTDRQGTLARIDPASGTIRATAHLPAGSFNPLYSDGVVWVTCAGGAVLTAVDATSGALIASVPTGPGPRFLAAGAGFIWTLNQGDGSLSRVDPQGQRETARIALGTPGHGGDISVGAGTVFTTMMGVPLSATDAATAILRRQWRGRGGDSLNIAHGAIWLTDYRKGTVARIPLAQVLAR